MHCHPISVPFFRLRCLVSLPRHVFGLRSKCSGRNRFGVFKFTFPLWCMLLHGYFYVSCSLAVEVNVNFKSYILVGGIDTFGLVVKLPISERVMF